MKKYKQTVITAMIVRPPASTSCCADPPHLMEHSREITHPGAHWAPWSAFEREPIIYLLMSKYILLFLIL